MLSKSKQKHVKPAERLIPANQGRSNPLYVLGITAFLIGLVALGASAKDVVLKGNIIENEKSAKFFAGQKAAADRSEALQHGHPLPGTDQRQLLIHGYVPPGMPLEQAIIMYNGLPNNLKMAPSMPQTGSPEWVARMAGEPADPLAGLPQGFDRKDIEVANQRLMEQSVRDRFGPVYIPPLHRDHNCPPQGANKLAAPASSQKNTMPAIPVKHSFTKEHLGSVREMTDSSGNVVAEYSYDPYGNQSKLSGSQSADFGYNGTYVHQPSGLLIMGARFYDPKPGRFLNRDPISEVGGMNVFAYAGNDPINRFDPSGTQPMTYGNWGGGGYVNGGYPPGGETSNFPYKPGQPGFRIPTTPRDRCYYWHDVCLHNCARIGSSDPKKDNPCDRQRCRHNCDTDLARCLENVLNTYGNEGFPQTLNQEIGGFSGTNPFPGYTSTPNDNPGEHVNGLQPYNYIDPGTEGF